MTAIGATKQLGFSCAERHRAASVVVVVAAARARSRATARLRARASEDRASESEPERAGASERERGQHTPNHERARASGIERASESEGEGDSKRERARARARASAEWRELHGNRRAEAASIAERHGKPQRHGKRHGKRRAEQQAPSAADQAARRMAWQSLSGSIARQTQHGKRSTASTGERSYCPQQRVGSSPACGRGREGGRAGRSRLDQGVAAGTEVWRMGRGVADGTKRGDLDRGVADRTTRGGQDEGVANWIAAWRMGRGRGGRDEGVADRTKRTGSGRGGRDRRVADGTGSGDSNSKTAHGRRRLPVFPSAAAVAAARRSPWHGLRGQGTPQRTAGGQGHSPHHK
jgi:hypothetical protein